MTQQNLVAEQPAGTSFKGLPGTLRARGELGCSGPHRSDQACRFQGVQVHLVCGEQHPIEALAHPFSGFRRDAMDYQPGARLCARRGDLGWIQQHLHQGPHPGRGTDAAAWDPGPSRGCFDGGTGLPMQKAARVSAFEPQQAHGLLDAAGLGGLPIPRGCHWPAELAAISSSKNRLCRSRPAAFMASRPPSWRSTMVTTRST